MVQFSIFFPGIHTYETQKKRKPGDPENPLVKILALRLNKSMLPWT
jgi:hypothetical protein